jgi:pimeloyl-ACP methyl ester carboxylesterase
MGNATEVLHRLALDDIEIEFSERGTGEPVVLVHAGVFADWFAPLATAPALDGLRVIRMRRAGYVAGPPPSRHLTMFDHARHVGALLDALGIRAAHLCGHSSSCLINLQLAMDRPEIVASLTLMDPAPGAVLQAPSQERFTAAVARPALAAAAGSTEEAFDVWMGGIGSNYRPIIEAALGPDGYRHAVSQSRFFFADELPAVREWALDRDRAAGLTLPVLLIHGGDSPPNFHDMVALLADVLTHAEVATLDGVGHLAPLQDPEHFGELLADFVGHHPIRTV